MNPESNESKDKGELMEFMKDIKEEINAMMKDLMEIDDTLLYLKNRLELAEVDKKEITKLIESVRLRIGVLEKEDKREMSEEEVAESLLEKLKKWVDMVV